VWLRIILNSWDGRKTAPYPELEYLNGTEGSLLYMYSRDKSDETTEPLSASVAAHIELQHNRHRNWGLESLVDLASRNLIVHGGMKGNEEISP
jgi:hypothetical protein